jgi:pilus assembly protein Flp/PilA
MRNLLSIRKNDRGATAVEYGLILALIFLAVAGAIGGVATVTIDMWGNVSNQVAAAH